MAVRFDDGTEQRIDFRPVLEGQLFGPLQDLNIFNAVMLDREVGTLVWPNGADFDPATLHDWPHLREDLVKMAQAGQRGRGRARAAARASARWNRRRRYCRRRAAVHREAVDMAVTCQVSNAFPSSPS
ncbi:MAG: DUF2442 domain-containing protein [Acidobacteria bacterium]|nr:DUF2442 domain-containing protein [Acidobacteriota bacterium]MCA1651731.1 DUF2442 domain-containing protein [Acidobacteriota bacterium]